MRRLISPGEYSTFRDKSNAGAPKMNYLSALRMAAFRKPKLPQTPRHPLSRARSPALKRILVSGCFIAARISPSRAQHFTSMHAASCGAGGKAEGGLGHGGTAPGIDPPACPERIRPPAHVLA